MKKIINSPIRYIIIIIEIGANGTTIVQWLNVLNNQNKIMNIEQTTPHTFWILLSIIGILLLMGTIIYWRLLDKINSLDKYGDRSKDETFDIIDMLQVANKRKMLYLFRCIKNGKIMPEPKSYFTDYEKKLLKKMSEERQTEIEKLAVKFSEEKEEK